MLSISSAYGNRRLTKRAIRETRKDAKSGDWFISDNISVKLADIVAPEVTSPIGAEARNVLQALLVNNGDITMDVLETDRWQQSVAYLYSQSSTALENSVQAILVAQGMCRVRPQSNEYENILGLMSIEQKARTARKGLWALRGQRRFIADEKVSVGDYRLVEGEVKEATIRQSRLYLNFGEDWRSDFTVTLAKSIARRWRLKYDEWSALKGVQIQSRGYVDKINGPSIDLIHPLQIVGADTAPRPLFSFVQVKHQVH